MASLICDGEFRHPDISFDPAQDAQSGDNPVINALCKEVPGLKIYSRSSPHYEALRQVYNTLITAKPLVVCRPQTIAQVQAIVKIVKRLGVPLGVRCGGHDVWGRGCVVDSVTIDMRELDEQRLAEDKKTVFVGGGVTSDNFVGFLNTHGLCTANGTAGHVGWTGWAIWGGYGPLNDYVGLGVDNIVAAKMITSDGELIEADDELLWGIRGAGGNLGIIVETEVKVHHMPKILAGFIGYAWDQAEHVLLGLENLLEGEAPDALCVQMGFMKSEWGTSLTLIFIWPSQDFGEGEYWLKKVRGLGDVVVDTVSETTFKDFQKITSRPVTDPANVCTRSASIPKFTATTVAQLTTAIERIPDIRQYNIIAHICHGKSVEANNDSSFATRERHVLFHINACDEPAEMATAVTWVNSVQQDLQSTGEAMNPVYASFMGEDEDARPCYRDGWDRLKGLKQRYDAEDTFCRSQPRLPVA